MRLESCVCGYLNNKRGFVAIYRQLPALFVLGGIGMFYAKII